MKWFIIFIVSLIATEIIYKLFFSKSSDKKSDTWQVKKENASSVATGTWQSRNQNEFESYSKKQLAEVLKCKFEKQRLFNHTEEKIFNLLNELVDTHAKGLYRINGQTSLGEILKCSERVAYNAINSKRVDFLIVDAQYMPVAVIEANGTGHYQNNALERDEIKRAAIESAGIKYIAIRENEKPMEKLERELISLISQKNEA